MRTVSESYTANVSKSFNIAGKRLEILSAPGLVTVSLQDANGIEITNGLASDIEAGSYMVPDNGFDRFVITSDTTGTVKFLVSYGEGGTRSVAGTVAVSGTVSTQETGLEYGASWYDNAANAANVPATIFTPAQNANGAILHQSFISSVNGGGVVNLVAKASAPTTVAQGDSMHLTVGDGAMRMNNQPIRIAAGKGLYYISSALETGGVRSALYTLL